MYTFTVAGRPRTLKPEIFKISLSPALLSTLVQVGDFLQFLASNMLSLLMCELAALTDLDHVSEETKTYI